MALTSEDLQAIGQLLQPIHSEIKEIKGELQTVKSNITEIKGELQTVKSDITEIKGELQTVKQKVTSIEMSIENELQVNIMRVAEGHIDLYRNMADMKHKIELMDGKMEVNDLFIRHHDSEIKKLKMM